MKTIILATIAILATAGSCGDNIQIPVERDFTCTVDLDCLGGEGCYAGYCSPLQACPEPEPQHVHCPPVVECPEPKACPKCEVCEPVDYYEDSYPVGC